MEVFPSPKVHKVLVYDPVDKLAKVTLSGARPLNGAALKSGSKSSLPMMRAAMSSVMVGSEDASGAK